MKMKKSFVALCLTVGLLAAAPGVSFADVNIVPQNTTAAPAIPASALQQLSWTPVDQSKTQTTELATMGQRLNVAGISGPVAAYSVPANIGELTLTLSSEVNKQTSVFAPNVLVLDQNMSPAAYFPSSFFTYQEPGVMSADRLEGVMRLTPAPAAKSEPMLNDTESYFNQAIKQAAAKGDIDKALKLLNEAERLGSTSARKTFISSVKGKG